MPETKFATALAQNPGFASSLASTVFGGLAGGVLWCFASVSTRYDTDVLIIPIGIALGALLRWQGFSGRRAMLCAAASTLIAFAYAQYLFSAVRIAQTLGFPLREALFKSGFALTADIAWGNIHLREGILLAGAIVLSMATASLRGKHRP